MLVLEAGEEVVEVGDFVQLAPRERPHTDDTNAWWELEYLDDTGFDARRWSGARIVERRRHVAFGSITGWRERA